LTARELKQLLPRVKDRAVKTGESEKNIKFIAKAAVEGALLFHYQSVLLVVLEADSKEFSICRLNMLLSIVLFHRLVT
jgi:hypothetical protein